MRMRLDKFLSAQGLSRKQARAAIASGQVLVNGEVQGDPGFILDPISAQVLFQGRALGPAGEHLGNLLRLCQHHGRTYPAGGHRGSG